MSRKGRKVHYVPRGHVKAHAAVPREKYKKQVYINLFFVFLLRGSPGWIRTNDPSLTFVLALLRGWTISSPVPLSIKGECGCKALPPTRLSEYSR